MRLQMFFLIKKWKDEFENKYFNTILCINIYIYYDWKS